MTATVGRTIRIDLDAGEVAALCDTIHHGLANDEASPFGHFLLECDGTSRTWVATDTAEMLVLTTSGSAPTGLDDPAERVEVLVNPRLFRNRPPRDCTLVIDDAGSDGERMVRLVGNQVETRAPEHPGDHVDWRSVIDGVGGVTVTIDTERLREAVRTAAAVPWSYEPGNVTMSFVSTEPGRVVFSTPWSGLPAGIAVAGAAVDECTAPTPIDINRLHHVLRQIDADVTELTITTNGGGPIAVRAGNYLGVLMPLDPYATERRRLEELLREFLDLDHLNKDDDGVYPVLSPDGQQLYVRLLEGSTPMVQVLSVLAEVPEPNLALFEEVNAINVSAPQIKAFWLDGRVGVAAECVAATLDLLELSTALTTVCRAAHEFGPLMRAYFVGVGKQPDDD